LFFAEFGEVGAERSFAGPAGEEGLPDHFIEESPGVEMVAGGEFPEGPGDTAVAGGRWVGGMSARVLHDRRPFQIRLP
jgi:hypothetical protein